MDIREFSNELEEQATKWKQQAEEFQRQLPDVSEEMKKQYEQQIAVMNDNAAKAQEMLARLKSANEAAWQDMATGAKNSFEEWQKAVQTALSRYKS